VTVIPALTEVEVVRVGFPVTFRCNEAHAEKILWGFTSSSDVPKTVFGGQNVTKKLKSRFSASGITLSISNVQLCDAGKYTCHRLNDDDFSAVNFQLITLG